MSIKPNAQLTTKVMSNKELFEASPSIFADSPVESVSSQYHFIKTSDLLDIFRESGYFPILGGESKSRTLEGQPYVKHIIQFRSLENLLKTPVDGLYYDICLKSSHNKTSAFTLELSCFRSICSNTLTVSTDQLLHRRIIHKGFQSSKVKMAIEEMVNYIPTVEEEFEDMKNTILSDIESLALSKTVIDFRFDTSKHEINPKELLAINREADSAQTAFNIYNRLQESIINGGIKLKNRLNQKTTTSKSVTAIDEKIKLNKKLHQTMQNLMSLKSEQYQIAA